MGASIHLCRGEGPRDPVEPGGGDRPEPAPDRGGPCRNLIQDFHDKAIVKLTLYEYLFDHKCEADKSASKLEPDTYAKLLSSALVRSLFNLAICYDTKDYSNLSIHDKFGMSVIAEMLRYAVVLSETSGSLLTSSRLINLSDTSIQIDLYMQSYPLDDDGDLADMVVLTGQCYIKAINEIKATAAAEDSFGVYHHLLMAYDVVSRAVQLFGNRRFKPTITEEMFSHKV